MANMETFNLNEDLHQHYDDIANLEMGNLTEVLAQMVGSISMINGLTPNASKNIKTSSNFDAKAKFAQEVLKVQWALNQQAWVLHHKFFIRILL
jgi:hypothetical protein